MHFYYGPLIRGFELETLRKFKVHVGHPTIATMQHVCKRTNVFFVDRLTAALNTTLLMNSAHSIYPMHTGNEYTIRTVDKYKNLHDLEVSRLPQ